tara:strand:+ start:181 stop:678 length:498 start_codon:yes stop_codon:yes gene_type:complete
MAGLDENDYNFLNDILIKKDWCSTVYCPDGYIEEPTGFAQCNSSPCDIDGEDLNICCQKICNDNSDCIQNKVCVTENNNISLCIDSCTDDNDCEDELSCLDTDNDGIFYCQADENRFMSLLNRIGFIIERTLYSDNIIVDTVILIIFAYLISKFINTFNININIT